MDVQLDPANCGGCAKACAAGQICASGACALVCPDGLTKCGGKCVDVQLDPANCGGCGQACGKDEVCSAGKCALLCLGGTVKCGSKCVDTQTDPANCGSCGNVCVKCTAGKCPPPTHRYWRFRETAVTVGHTPRTCELRWVDVDAVKRAPNSYSTPMDLSSGPPFDGATNYSDQGWIVSFSPEQDRYVVMDFGMPGFALLKFGAFTSYTGGQRGADWDIAWSDDGNTWHSVGTFHYLTTQGGAVEGGQGYAGWYELTWDASKLSP
ncbi:MAG: hypothetical protein HY744_14110 [Deltaproteobacteria bacterium]|nr:hypothetical protein [Deltaproteobacteria bacterium]